MREDKVSCWVNYYPHHIGDYLRDTLHLSLLEHGAYRRLLDYYYASEKPLPLDVSWVCRLIRADTNLEQETVSWVLRNFFVQRSDGWHNKRADDEIRASNTRAKASRINGKKGGRPKTRQVISRLAKPNLANNLDESSQNQNQNQISTTASTADFDEVWAIFPRRAGGNPKAKALKAYRARRLEHGHAEILEGTKRYAAFVRATGKEGTEFVKQAATFLGPDKHFLEQWTLPEQGNVSPLYSRQGAM